MTGTGSQTEQTEAPAAFFRKLVVLVLLSNILVYSLVGLTLWQSRIQIEQQAETTTQNLAVALDLNIGGILDKADLALLAVVNEAERMIAGGGINRSAINAFIARIHSYTPKLTGGLRMTDASGNLLYGTGLTAGQKITIADRDNFKHWRDNPGDKAFISKPLFGQVAHKWVFHISRRINNPDGSFAGIVLGAFAIESFVQMFSSIDVGTHGSITLGDTDLAIIARYPEPAGHGSTAGSKVVSKQFRELTGSGREAATYKAVYPGDKVERIYSYRTISGYPLYVNVGRATIDIFKGWRRDAAVYLFLAALFTIGSLLTSRMLVLNWKREKEVEEQLRSANEELELRVEKRTHDLQIAGDRLQLELAERKQAEEDLRQSEEMFRQFVGHSPIYTFIKDEKLKVVQISNNYKKMLGMPAEQILGKGMGELFPPDFAAKIIQDDLRVLESGVPIQEDESFEGRHYTSVKFPINCGNKKFLAGYTIDITEQKNAEEERIRFERKLLQTQKLESLGILAGGIAHDFNNILQAIIGNADLALMRTRGESPLRVNLKAIMQAAFRAADLAKQMLAYSGKGKFVIKSINLAGLVEEMTTMLQVSVSKRVQLRFNFAPLLPPVDADPTQLQQIVMNLVINASEAMGENSGVITVTTGYFHGDQAGLKELCLDEQLAEGTYVYLEVSDTGCGMDQETMAKIFDPFFTTKYPGRGLGLAAAQGIVRGHKGAFKVRSEPGKGTTFTVFLPAGSSPEERTGAQADRHSDWQGSGSLLLVDDEESVLSASSEMLETMGFSVITAMDGRSGIQKYIENRESIVCVILDLTMPQMDGKQCFQELFRINPKVKVIMSSGFNQQELSQAFQDPGISGFIQKPYSLAELRKKLRAVLDAA